MIRSGYRRYVRMERRPSMSSSKRCACSLCVTTALFRFTSTDHPSKEFIREFAKSGNDRVGRLGVEEPGQFSVVNDYRGIALDGVEGFLLEGVAGFRGNEHFPGQRNGTAGVIRSDRFLGS